MIKKIICLAMMVGLLVFAGDTVDADRPGLGYAQMELGLMNWRDLGFDLPDTLATSDTMFSLWMGDYTGEVNAVVFSIGCDINQYKTFTGQMKLYTQWANDTTDPFLVDSCRSGGAVATFDSTVQLVYNGAAWYRFYFVSSCTCVVNDFTLQVTGYGK